MLLACIIGTSASYLLLGLADTLTLIIVAILLDGATGDNLAVAQAYIADSTSRDKRARGLGLIGAAFGLITGPAIGGLLSLYSFSARGFTIIRTEMSTDPTQVPLAESPGISPITLGRPQPPVSGIT